jgi:hypothetical protein
MFLRLSKKEQKETHFFEKSATTNATICFDKTCIGYCQLGCCWFCDIKDYSQLENNSVTGIRVKYHGSIFFNFHGFSE